MLRTNAVNFFGLILKEIVFSLPLFFWRFHRINVRLFVYDFAHRIEADLFDSLLGYFCVTNIKRCVLLLFDQIAAIPKYMSVCIW